MLTSGIKLFRLFGIQVYLHWTWAVAVYWMVQNRSRPGLSPAWNVAEILALFAIVLMHEFGHALACKSVGGQAERIMLWPLGGVAFVSPPQRPGAVLWSIAAGPLVNVLLAPITIGAYLWARQSPAVSPEATSFLYHVAAINIGLFVFNMLPIYPLDGGQILRALLWFLIGASRSLMVASIIGLVGAAAGLVLALWVQDTWLILLAAFAALQSWSAFQRSKTMQAVDQTPRHTGFRCPSCGNSPPALAAWTCACGKPIDIFASRGQCPNCGAQFRSIPCPFCGKASPPEAWQTFQVAPAGQNLGVRQT